MSEISMCFDYLIASVIEIICASTVTIGCNLFYESVYSDFRALALELDKGTPGLEMLSCPSDTRVTRNCLFYLWLGVQ